MCSTIASVVRVAAQTPATAHDQMNYFWSKGVRLMRLPVKWERIQPALFGPLYYGPDEPFTATNDLDMRRIAEVIAYWTGLGGVVLFDLHNYMGYAGTDSAGMKMLLPFL